MGYKKRGHGIDHSREKGSFIAMPCRVLDSPAYQRLPHPARALLFEIDRQYMGKNNGQLLASAAYLGPRGWNSNDVITRALKQLTDAKLIHQTVKGHRPNKASWYAVTWRQIDAHPDYDPGARETFRRGAYADGEPLKTGRGTVDRAERRQALYKKWPLKNATLKPSEGVEGISIAPSGGVEAHPPAPSGGAVNGTFRDSPTPSGGDHLEVTISPCASNGGGDGAAVGRSPTWAVAGFALNADRRRAVVAGLLEEVAARAEAAT